MKNLIATLPLLIACAPALASQAEVERAMAAAEAARADAASAISDAEREKMRAELRSAQAELSQASKRIAELSMKLNDFTPRAFALEYLHSPQRALIGVILGADDKGVKIIALTPNGPAAKAGVQVGDYLQSINGKAVLKSAAGDAAQTAAIDAARELIGELEDGEVVKLDVLRNGSKIALTPKAERREPAQWTRQLLGDLPNLDVLRLQGLEHLQDLPEMKERLKEMKELRALRLPDQEVEVIVKEHMDAHAPIAKRIDRIMIERGQRLNLSTLNPDLARYFGTDRGVLLLENNPDMLPELKAGDVIQVIDGQPADSVTDVMRALGKKAPGEILNIEVMRDRQRQVLAIKAPAQRAFFFDEETFRHHPTPAPTPKAAPAPKGAPGTAPLPTPRPPAPIPAPKGLSV